MLSLSRLKTLRRQCLSPDYAKHLNDLDEFATTQTAARTMSRSAATERNLDAAADKFLDSILGPLVNAPPGKYTSKQQTTRRYGPCHGGMFGSSRPKNRKPTTAARPFNGDDYDDDGDHRALTPPPAPSRSKLPSWWRHDDPALLETCYHEAGHAVAAYVLGHSIHHISAIPANGYAGTCRFDSFSDPEKQAIAIMAGAAAMRQFMQGNAYDFSRLYDLHSGRPIDGLDVDYSRVRDLLGDEQGWSRSIVNIKAADLVRDYWPAVESVANSLALVGEMSGTSAEFLIANAIKNNGGKS